MMEAEQAGTKRGVLLDPILGARRLRQLLARGSALILYDGIAALVAFSLVTLVALWAVSVEWLILAEHAADLCGLPGYTCSGTSTSGQDALAWSGTFAGPLLVLPVLMLGRAAFELPALLWRGSAPLQSTGREV